MQFLLDLLFVATDALLWPVVLGLVVMGAYALFTAGIAVREALTRADRSQTRVGAFRSLPATQRSAEFERLEQQFARSVDRDAMMSRLGPMFGLAGTLIPLGPGLRQLHGGNLAGLGEQLAVAFATTIAGLFVCAVCYAVAGLRGRWYEQELRALEAVGKEPARG